MSDQEKQPQERVVLGIHTNTKPGAPLIDGHAWLTITRDGKTEAYGLWPANHPRFGNETTPPATDIRRGIENNFDATASRYYALSSEQLREFEAASREKVTWGYSNTCASWASDTVYRVTGERVIASEIGGLTDTPREIRESIDALERQQDTSRDAPREPVDAPKERGSSSSSLSMEGDREMLQSIRKGVAGIDQQYGREFDPTSERLSASLLATAKSNGLERVDHVVLGNPPTNGSGQRMFVVQGELDNPAHQRASVAISEAINTPVEQSLAKAEQISQAQQQIAQQDHAQEQTRAAMRMG